MNGQPVWLASISRRDSKGARVYVPEWGKAVRDVAERLLRQMVDGVGNPSRERLFRMNVTMCLHRAASDEEVAAQSEEFRCAPGNGLAGGPVEILAETEQGSPSTRPCEAPDRHVIDRASPHGWIPVDCGDCEPCLARANFMAAKGGQ